MTQTQRVPLKRVIRFACRIDHAPGELQVLWRYVKYLEKHNVNWVKQRYAMNAMNTVEAIAALYAQVNV